MPEENELHLGFETKKTCPSPLNRGVPSIEATGTKVIGTLFGDQILGPLIEWRGPKGEVPMYYFC